MRNIFTIIFIALIIPFVIALITISKVSKNQNQPINQNFLTNKIENKKEWSTTNLQQINKRILKDQVLTQEFKSDHNNLGTIAVQFTNFQKINDDYILFNISEKNTNKIIYENKYKVDQFNPDFPFTFGFQPIKNSKDKTYIFEIKSISGKTDNSVGIANQKYFTTKYDFSLNTIKNKPSYGLELIQINLLSTKFINKIPLSYFLYLYIIFIIIFIFRKKIKIKAKNILSIIKKKLIQIITKINITKINLVLQKQLPLIIFLLTFIISSYFSTIGTDPHHDGIMFKPALDVSQGQMLFRDTFTQYGAITTIIQALSLKIFGQYLIVIKITTALFYALTSVVLFFISTKILNKKLSFLSCIIWIFLAPYFALTFLPWSSVYALFFECLALLFVLKYLENNYIKYIFWAGIYAGLTFWCKQNVGGYIIIASFLSIALVHILNKKKIKDSYLIILKFIQGGVTISIPIFIWLIFNGALIDWWKQSIIYIFIFMESRTNISFINSLFPASIGAISVWTVMPIITLIALLTESFNKKPNLTIVVISIFSLFSWLQYYPVTCLRHVYWAATPMVGITIFQLLKLSESIFKNKFILKYLFLLFLIYSIFFNDIKYRINKGLEKYNQNYFHLENPKILQGMKLTAPEANFYKKTFEEIYNYKNKNGDVNLITIGPNALYTTFDKSKNFHKMYVNWGGALYPDYPVIKDKYIENNLPLIYSIWEIIPPGYCRFNDLINEVDTSFLIAPCKNIN